MNISRKRQSQFELFPGTSKSSPETGKSAHLTKDLTLSLENIIVLCIIVVMNLVLFFSFGVEKGKRVAKTSDDAYLAEAALLGSAESATKISQEEGIGPSIDIPENVTEDSGLAFEEPRQIHDEQERLFTIQVASFKLKKNAQREADRLKGIGHADAFVLLKGSYSIVCVGKFSQRHEAKEFSSKLQSRYNDCLVRRL